MSSMWFYTANGSEKQGPVSEDQIRSLIGNGTLKPTDLVWSEGMSDWAPVNTIPAFQPGGPRPVVAQGPVAGGGELPPGLLGWMSFVGVMTIIYGVFQLCSFLIGIIPIVGGVALMGAKTALSELPRIDPNMQPFLAKLKTFMAMTGVLYILGIVFAILIFVLYIIMGAAAFSSMGDMSY